MEIYFYTFGISKTGELLYNRLKSHLIQHASDIPLDDITERDVLIRWGRSDCSYLDNRFSRVFNSAGSLSTVHNKAGFLLHCYRNDIRVPRVFLSPEEITKFPVIGRKHNYHSHGNWCFFIRHPRSIRRAGNRHHYVEFIRGSVELRAHVIGDKVVRISRKVPNPEFTGKFNKRIRSHKRGWVYIDDFDFIDDNSHLIHEVKHQVLNAFKLSELTFGAVDCIVRDYNNLPYILEINSAPSLNRYGRRLYEYQLRSLIDKPQRRWFRQEGLRRI